MRVRHAVTPLAPLLVGGCILATDLDSFSAGDNAGASDSGIDTSMANDGAPPVVTPVAEGGADADAAPPSLTWGDDFNRSNGKVGNGWIEGQANVWSIDQNHVNVIGFGLSFTQVLLHRPAAEALRDLIASVEFTTTGSPPSFPQVHVRATATPYRSYAVGVPAQTKKIFWVHATVSKQTTLGEVTLSEDIVVGRRHRLSMSATGQSPVELSVKIERATDDGGWKVIGSGSSSDGGPERIETAGTFGISSDGIPNYTYDNFSVTKL